MEKGKYRRGEEGGDVGGEEEDGGDEQKDAENIRDEIKCKTQWKKSEEME